MEPSAPRYSDLFVSVGALRLHYLDWSESGEPPLLFLHGVGGHAHIWDAVAKRLSYTYRVLAMDQRGHGDSEWPVEPLYRASDYVGDLAGFVKALALQDIVLVGHSMGALHAMIYAAQHANIVNGMVVVDIEPRLPLWQVDFLHRRGAHLTQTSSVTEQDVRQRVRTESPWIEDKTLDSLVNHETKKGVDGSLYYKFDPRAMLFFDAYDVTSYLPNISCPTLVMRGVESLVARESQMVELSKSLQQGELQQIERAGHFAFLDNPAAFTQAMEEFLQRL